MTGHGAFSSTWTCETGVETMKNDSDSGDLDAGRLTSGRRPHARREVRYVPLDVQRPGTDAPAAASAPRRRRGSSGWYVAPVRNLRGHVYRAHAWDPERGGYIVVGTYDREDQATRNARAAARRMDRAEGSRLAAIAKEARRGRTGRPVPRPWDYAISLVKAEARIASVFAEMAEHPQAWHTRGLSLEDGLAVLDRIPAHVRMSMLLYLDREDDPIYALVMTHYDGAMLEDIGRAYGCTRERVRQIDVDARRMAQDYEGRADVRELLDGRERGHTIWDALEAASNG